MCILSLRFELSKYLGRERGVKGWNLRITLHKHTFYQTAGDRIPAVARFSATVQTGPGALHSLLYNGYHVSFPGVKRPGRGVNHPPKSSAEVKERVELYIKPSRLALGRNFKHILCVFMCFI